MTTPAETSSAPDSRSDLIEQIRLVADSIKGRAGLTDEARTIPDATMQDLQEGGLLAVNLPRSAGGLEADLVTLTQMHEIMGGACASTAWCLGNHLATLGIIRATMQAGATPFVQEAVADGKFLGHAAVPAGTTRAVPGGFQTSGRWPFISGSLQARWSFLSTMVDGPPDGWTSDNGEAPPAAHNVWLGVRMDDPAVQVDETWRAMSVRASMSHDVVVTDLFVPQEQTFILPALGAGALPLLSDDPAALQVPILIQAVSFVASMAVGIAQAALEDTVAYGSNASMYLGGQPEGSRRGSMPGNQFAVADAAMLVESGRAFLAQEVRALSAKAGREPYSEEDITRLLMATIVARENAERAVDALFRVRGAHGLFESGNFERYYRDIRMPTLHGAMTPDLFRELIGKFLFGIPAAVQPRWG